MVTTFIEYCYAFITIILLAVFFLRSQKNTHSKKILLKEWMLFGGIFGAFAFSWLFSVYPLLWMDTGIIQIIGISLIYTLVVLVCSCSYSIAGFSFILKKPFNYIVFPILLAFGELIRSLLLSLLFSGNGGSFGLHFSASTLGGFLSLTPFVEFAYFGGPFILTGISGVLIVIFLGDISKKQKFYSFLTLIVLLVGVHLLPTSTPKTPLIISIITTDFEAPKRDSINPFPERFKAMHELVKNVSQKKPDLIIFPEDSRYTEYLTPSTKTELLSLFRNTTFVDGRTFQKKEGLSNYSVFYNPNDSTHRGRGKVFLFPFNEYIPSAFSPLFSYFIGEKEYRDYSKDHTYTPSTPSPSYITPEGLSISTLICSEILSYQTVETTKKNFSDLIVFQSQLSVFNKNPFSMATLRFSARIAAAQTRTLLVSTSNQFESYIVSPHGKLLVVTPSSLSTKTYLIEKETLSER